MTDTVWSDGPTQLTNSAATVYTVPGATTLILRDIHFCNTSASAATVFFSIGVDATGTRMYSGLSIPGNSTLSRQGNWVISTGTDLQAYSGTNNVVNLLLSGVLVT